MRMLFFSFYLVNKWIQIPLKSDHHRPASKTHFNDGPTLNAVFVAL